MLYPTWPVLQTRVLVCRTLRGLYAREKPDQKQEIASTAITYINGNTTCWLERKSWPWGKGSEGLCVRKEARELLRPYITGLSGESPEHTAGNANILCRHHVVGTEEARQHEPRQMPMAV